MHHLGEETSILLGQLGPQAALAPAYRFAAATPVMLLLRDSVDTSLAWESAVRGGNASSLAADELQDRRGNPLLPELRQAEFPFQAGYQWQLAPNGTKTQQERRAGYLPLEVKAPALRHLDPLRLIHKLIQVTHTAGQPPLPPPPGAGTDRQCAHQARPAPPPRNPCLPVRLTPAAPRQRRCTLPIPTHHKHHCRCTCGLACPPTATCCIPSQQPAGHSAPVPCQPTP